MKRYLFLVLSCLAVIPVKALPDRSYKEELTAILSQLVSMNTITSDQESNLKALKWVEERLKPLGLNTKFHQFNGYSSLLLTTQKTQRPKVWLVAHIDVVPGSKALFTPKVKNNKLYGRGAYDMKMAIACYILLMEELKESLSSYNLGIMLTSDEEIGGMNGVKQLLQMGYSSEVVLLPDGGFDWNFEEQAKGVLQAKVTAHGNTAHGSRPWMGENAIDKLLGALQAIHLYFEQSKEEGSLYFPTVNVGVIQGGSSVNQVPDLAEAKLDIRFPFPLTAPKLLGDLREVLKQQPGVEIESLIDASPHKVDLTHPCFQKFKRYSKEYCGKEVGSLCAHGSSDARFFGEKKIPVLVIAPKGGEIHSEKEWVDLDDLDRFYRVMKGWVLDVSK